MFQYSNRALVPDTSDDGDRSLTSRLARSDASAFEEIVSRHWTGIALFAARLLNDREAAKDVSQETFIRLWTGRERLRPGLLRPFLYRVARNLVADELRKRSVRARWEEDLHPFPDEDGPEDPLHERELHEAVAKAVQSLAPRRRQALTLAFLHDLPYKEVAAVMGISVATVRNSVSSALSDLRDTLAPHHRL